MVNVPTGA